MYIFYTYPDGHNWKWLRIDVLATVNSWEPRLCPYPDGHVVVAQKLPEDDHLTVQHRMMMSEQDHDSAYIRIAWCALGIRRRPDVNTSHDNHDNHDNDGPPPH